MSELMKKRTPELIGAEIRMYVDTGRRLSLLCGIEIGRRRTEAKEMLQHGEWLPWLERETEFSSSSAQRYMKLFEEYGASQQGLFGPETNSPTLGNLPISKAFALLSVPESDRIEFAETVDAEHISVRELEEKIKERERQIEALRKDVDGEKQRLEESERMRKETEALLNTQDDMLKEAKKQIQDLENRPVEVAVETVRDEEAIRQAAEEAKKKTAAEFEKTVKHLETQLNKAENERAEAVKKAENAEKGAEEKRKAAETEAERVRAELEEAKKKLKASDANVTAFGIRYNTIQDDFGKLKEALKTVQEQDKETGAKLREAVRQLVEYFRKELEQDV